MKFTIVRTHVGSYVGKYVGTHVQTRIFSGSCCAPPHWSFRSDDFAFLLDFVPNVDPSRPDVDPVPVPMPCIVAEYGVIPTEDEPKLGPLQDDPPLLDAIPTPLPAPVPDVVADNGGLPTEDDPELGPPQEDPPPPDAIPTPVPAPTPGVVAGNIALPAEDELELEAPQDEPELGPPHDERQLGASTYTHGHSTLCL
jgi:hypothetical protein